MGATLRVRKPFVCFVIGLWTMLHACIGIQYFDSFSSDVFWIVIILFVSNLEINAVRSDVILDHVF